MKEELIKEINKIISEKKLENDFCNKNNIYGCIYLITSPENKNYIGQYKITKTNNLQRRMYTHRSLSKKLYGKNLTPMKIALKKYDIDLWKKQIIDIGYSKEELSELERKNIEKYKTIENGYNVVQGGYGGCLGYKHKPEDIAKIAHNNSIRGVSEETKAKIGKANSGHYNISPLCVEIDMFYDGVYMKTFPSIREITRFLGIRPICESSIRRCLKKPKHLRAYGFTYDYHNESNNYIQTKTDEEILSYAQNLRKSNEQTNK